jgi:site-specific recombinase XerD
MLDLIVPEASGELVPSLDLERALYEANRTASRATSTVRAYLADGRKFVKWCHQRGLNPRHADPDTIGMHLSSEAARGLSHGSLSRRVAGIRYALLSIGVPENELPTKHQRVRETLSGIPENYPQVSHQKAAATTPVVRAMLDTCDLDTMLGRRDRALLALGFAGAFRRSELVALNVEDLETVEDGFRVTIQRSKTNRKPEVIPIGHGSILRPVEAVQAWLQAADITSGPIFLEVHRSGAVRRQRTRKGVIRDGRITPAMVALVVKRRAKAAGIKDEEIVRLSGHSLRAGFITSAAEAGKNVFKIMAVSRHKSMDVMRGYVRNREMFKDYAGAGII